MLSPCKFLPLVFFPMLLLLDAAAVFFFCHVTLFANSFETHYSLPTSRKTVLQLGTHKNDEKLTFRLMVVFITTIRFRNWRPIPPVINFIDVQTASISLSPERTAAMKVRILSKKVQRLNFLKIFYKGTGHTLIIDSCLSEQPYISCKASQRHFRKLSNCVMTAAKRKVVWGKKRQPINAESLHPTPIIVVITELKQTAPSISWINQRIYFYPCKNIWLI